MPQAGELRHDPLGSAPLLEEGACYLVRGKTAESSYRLLRRLSEDGTPALCVTRLHPDRVRSRYGLGNVTVWWISTSPGEDNVNPTAIGTLANAIESFVDDHPQGCTVMLDGLEFLAVSVGFDKTLLFLEHLNEFVMPRRAKLLVPISPECFEATDLARLERFTERLDEADLRDSLAVSDLDRYEIGD